jgi:hypothetical protein
MCGRYPFACAASAPWRQSPGVTTTILSCNASVVTDRCPSLRIGDWLSERTERTRARRAAAPISWRAFGFGFRYAGNHRRNAARSASVLLRSCALTAIRARDSQAAARKRIVEICRVRPHAGVINRCFRRMLRNLCGLLRAFAAVRLLHESVAASVSGLPDVRRRADRAQPDRNKLDEVEFLIARCALCVEFGFAKTVVVFRVRQTFPRRARSIRRAFRLRRESPGSQLRSPTRVPAAPY